MPTTKAQEMAAPGEDSTARWPMVCAGAALIGTCYGLARFAYGLFVPEFMAEFAISSTVSGFIAAGSYVGYCAAIVMSLWLTPRWGPRPVAILAGIVATAGIATVAAAPSAQVLAGGVLLAGSSTGIASPPMAAAVGRWVRAGAQDRAQTMVNAGTGLGVLVSGPAALVLLDQWRLAWAGFAVLAAAVTGWIAAAVPAGGGRDPLFRRAAAEIPNRAGSLHRNASPRDRRVAGLLVPGAARLMGASFVVGLCSIAVWGFSRDLLSTETEVSDFVTAGLWTVLGAAGILGAFAGYAVQRVGASISWAALVLALGVATALFGLSPSSIPVVFVAAALFGSSYIGLAGLVLLWSTRLYPDRVAFGVGISFFVLAAGQAVGAPVVGGLIEAFRPPTVFLGWSCLALIGALLRPVARPARP